MSRMRDISKFLARTAKANTDNVRVKFDGEPRTTRLVTSAVTNTIINDITAKYELTQDSLATSGLVAGDMTLVESAYDGARLYLSNGSGWYNVALVNTTPSFSFDSSLYTLDSENDSVLITFSDSDFDQTNLQDAVISFQPANITDSAINSSIVGNNITLTVRDSALGTYSFQVLGSISDGLAVGTDQATITLTLFTYSPDMQIVGSSGGTIINVDSDVVGGRFQVASGDTLQDSTGAITATVSSATFLDNTQQSRTSAGNTVGIDVGSGKVGIPTGNLDSSHIGWVWNYNSSNTTAASNFRSGSQYGGQIISHLSERDAVWAANTTNLSSMYVYGAVGGSYYRSYAGIVCTQYSLTTNGGSTRKGTLPIHSTNNFETWSPYSDGLKNGSDHSITMKVDGLTASNQQVNYNWPVPSYTANWTARTVSIRSNNGSSIGGGTSMQTSMVFDGNQTANFPVGGLVHIGESGSANAPTAQEVYEGKFFTIVMTCLFSTNQGSAFNMSTSYSGGTVSKWSRATSNSYYFGVRANSGQTGVILAGNMGYTQNTVYGSSLQTSTSANGMNQSVTMYVRPANLCNEVYIISPDYPLYGGNQRFDNGYASDMRPTYAEWSTTNNVSGASFGTSTYPIYKQTSSPYTLLELDPSPAGDGTNVNIGTSVYGSYVWKNETSITVDDNTGLTTTGNFLKYTDV